MTKEERDIQRKKRVLQYADTISDVSKACRRYHGVCRSDGRLSRQPWPRVNAYVAGSGVLVTSPYVQLGQVTFEAPKIGTSTEASKPDVLPVRGELSRNGELSLAAIAATIARPSPLPSAVAPARSKRRPRRARISPATTGPSFATVSRPCGVKFTCTVPPSAP